MRRPVRGLSALTLTLAFVGGLRAADDAPEYIVEIDGFAVPAATAIDARAAFNDPDAAFAALAEKGRAAEAVSPFFTCGVCVKPAIAAWFVDRDGKRVYACSEACRAALPGAWDAALAKILANRPAQKFGLLSNRPLPEGRARGYLVTLDDGFRYLSDVPSESFREHKTISVSLFAELAKNGDVAEPVSQVCPIMGNRVNRAVYIDRDGRRVFLCCKGCIGRANKQWVDVLKKLAEAAQQPDPQPMPTM